MAAVPAILLLGPTGSGKTPLGDLLEARGLAGRRCVHFDFGARLRRIAETAPTAFTAEEIVFIRRVLETGALLEDEHFPIAERILRGFLAEETRDRHPFFLGSRTGAILDIGPGKRGACPYFLVVLNGLPRHVGQAADVGRTVDVRAVVCLACTPAVVFERIRANAGGDRAGRLDDDEAAVAGKLEIYRKRIQPLAAYYRDRGVPVITIDVQADTTADDMATALVKSLGSL